MSDISSYSKVTLSKDQIIAAGLIENFIFDEIDRVFILAGHAGTGKTTLLAAVINYLKAHSIPVVLLASTGRAAKVVQEKTTCNAETVHKHIYEVGTDENDKKKKIRKLNFKLRENNNSLNTVYIVDECSMISNHFTQNVFIKFGSGKLLTDFFSYIQNRKVIFSGDPFQLPPINTLFSPCLNPDYLIENFKKPTVFFNLTEVLRFDIHSGISYNTKYLRDAIESKQCINFKVKATPFPDFSIYGNIEEMVQEYVKNIKKLGIHNTIFLTYTNALASEINKISRSLLFPNKTNIVKNELLVVIQNNYKYGLSNGEHIVIESISENKIHRAGLTFIEVTFTVNTINGQILQKALLIEELLYNKEPNLTAEQEYNLYQDFISRMYEQDMHSCDPDFSKNMMSDIYLNALRTKFGYAITCHKAQGGEWSDVFVVMEDVILGQKNKTYLFQWTYTAISRAVKNIHILNCKYVN